jgi:hypothetical protein
LYYHNERGNLFSEFFIQKNQYEKTFKKIVAQRTPIVVSNEKGGYEKEKL